jgi:hypothetical protein
MAAASRLKLLEVIVRRLVLLLALGLRLAPVLPAGRRVLPLAPRTRHRRHRPAGPGRCWAGIVVGNEDRHVVIHASFHAFCRTVLPLRSQVQPLFRRYLRRQVSMDWTRLRGRGNCSPGTPACARVFGENDTRRKPYRPSRRQAAKGPAIAPRLPRSRPKRTRRAICLLAARRELKRSPGSPLPEGPAAAAGSSTSARHRPRVRAGPASWRPPHCRAR